MSQLRRLAGQTAIYGVSSILGRVINYLLVPIHTATFGRGPMGDVSVLFTLATFMLVVYTFGMETTYFRFVNKENNSKAYSQAATAVLVTSTLLSIPLLLFTEELAELIQQPDSVLIMRCLAVILWIDGAMAIPFARLRHENRPVRFASIRIAQTSINVGLQVFFLLLAPGFISIDAINNPDGSPGIGYIFLANLIGNLILIPLLWGYLRQIKLIFHWPAFKPMLNYALPVMLTGLAGMFSEYVANIILRFRLSDTFYSNMTSREAVGVYSQTLKLGVFMTLAIQAFRYAAEPFFFSQAKEKDSPVLFARVMHYFILTALALMFAVSLNVELIGHLFLRQPEFRVALYLVPILLFAKLIYGVYMNLSIWFKLTDRTQYGLYFSFTGAAITILGNIFLIPYIGYDASALSMVICYSVMAALCYIYGQKFYPIPYRFLKTIPYFVITIGLIILGNQIELENFILESAIKIIFTLIVLGLFFFYERKSLSEPEKN